MFSSESLVHEEFLPGLAAIEQNLVRKKDALKCQNIWKPFREEMGAQNDNVAFQ